MRLLREIEQHLRRTGIPAARFGRCAANDPMLVFDLRRGREPGAAMRQRVRAYLAAQAEQAQGEEQAR